MKIRTSFRANTLEEKWSFVSKLVISALIKTFSLSRQEGRIVFSSWIFVPFFPPFPSFFPLLLLPPCLLSSLLSLLPIIYLFFNNSTREGRVLRQGRICSCVRLAVVFSLVLLFVCPLLGLFSCCADYFSMWKRNGCG